MDLLERDVDYVHDDTRMRGRLFTPSFTAPLACVALIHDAFGLGPDMMARAREYAALGYAVFALDVWGERATPERESEIGPLIGAMVRDRDRWLARLEAGISAARAQPEVLADAVVAIGYCFGGSSALEHLRAGGAVRGVVGIHAGLDLLHDDWRGPAGDAKVLVCTGADDPMATPAQRDALLAALDGAGIDWEMDLYSDTRHAFTNPRSADSSMPDVVAYNPRSAARAWASTTRFLQETLAPDAA